MDLHFHRRPVLVPVFKDRTQRDMRKKSKDKGKRPHIQRRIAKGEITKLGDDQERRQYQVAQNGLSVREFLT